MSNREEITELISALQAENRQARANQARIFLLNATVRPYSGSSNPVKVKEFIDEIIRISVGFDLNDEQLKIVAGRNMVGAAENWYKQYTNKEENKTDDFDEFHTKLSEYFNKEHVAQEQTERFETLKQAGRIDKFNLAYILALELLSNEPSSDSMKMNFNLTKLKVNLRTEVKCRDPKTLDEAMRIALLMIKETMDSCINPHPKTIKESFINPSTNTKIESL